MGAVLALGAGIVPVQPTIIDPAASKKATHLDLFTMLIDANPRLQRMTRAARSFRTPRGGLCRRERGETPRRPGNRDNRPRNRDTSPGTVNCGRRLTDTGEMRRRLGRRGQLALA